MDKNFKEDENNLNQPQNNQENTNINPNEDDFIIGKNFTIPNIEEPESSKEDTLNTNDTKKQKKKRSRRSRKRIRSLIVTLIIIAVSVFLALVIMMFASEYLGIGFNKDGSNCTIDIKQGYSTSQIAAELKKEGVINSKILFSLYCRVSGVDKDFKYGVYNFTNELGYKDLAELLKTEGEMDNVVRVTIPERASVDDIMKILEEKGVCTKSDFKYAMENGNFKGISIIEDIPVNKVHYRFEGYLFPDTYDFYTYDSKECAELAIKKMLKQTDDIFTEKYKADIKKAGFTIHEVLTMASIVELEASASTDEMPKVAQVFYNRLNWDEPKFFGSSPTAEYPYGNGRYNTNTHEGFPPGPMCAPSLAAIKAAAYPDTTTTATYFVTDSNNVFYYNETYAQHNQTIAKLKSEGKWIG